MTGFGVLIADQLVGMEKPKFTAAQRALSEDKVISPNSLLHGDYYSGLLDDMTTTARWHAHKRCFVFWVHYMGQPRLKAAPHVAEPGAEPRFAPIARQESEGGSHISDFAFETTR